MVAIGGDVSLQGRAGSRGALPPVLDRIPALSAIEPPLTSRLVADHKAPCGRGSIVPVHLPDMSQP